MAKEPLVDPTVARPPGQRSAVSSTEADRALVDAMLAGDRKAIGRFVQLYSDHVYRYLHSRLDRPEVTDDLVQEVFLAAWQGLAEFRSHSELATWLIGIARHKLADYYRERFRRLLPLDEESEDTAPATSVGADVLLNAALDAQANRARIERIMRDLGAAHRAVLLWRYWDGRSLTDMAAITGRTPKAMERLLARARQEFKLRWSDDKRV